jgi:hypothetical protein
MVARASNSLQTVRANDFLLSLSITNKWADLSKFTYTIPKSLPSGDYLVRIEHIALHVAQSYGGAQVCEIRL